MTNPDDLAFYLCAGPDGATIETLVRVAGTRWAIEECFKHAKGETGLDHYQVRRYDGWYRHITLSMLAYAYLAITAASDPKAAVDTVAASAVLNQAALIASDCGDPELARHWCHRHTAAYLQADLSGARAARNTLEPLVNLARLRIRDGDTAYRILDALLRAVTDATHITIDGLHIPTSNLIRSDDDQRNVRQWLWAVHLADGTRALTTAHRWQDALHHLHRHNGIGNCMLDGRQGSLPGDGGS